MASKPEGEPTLLREISDGLQIPHHFLNKVLQQLTKQGLVVSHKGTNGGFTLGRPADEITLWDIVRAVEGETVLEGCVLGFPGCNDKSPCPVHHQWKLAQAVLSGMLNEKSVGELGVTLHTKLKYLQQLRGH